MDDSLNFSQEDQPLSLTSFDSTPANPPFGFQHTTWPMVNLQMAHPASNSPTSRNTDLEDHSSAITSPLPPIPSPAFDMNPSAQDQNLTIPTSTALGMSPSMASSMAHLQLAGFTDGQTSSADLQIPTSVTSSQPPLSSADLTLHQALNITATSSMLSGPFPAFSLTGLNTSQPLDGTNVMAYTGSYDLPLHTSPTDELLPTTQAQMQQSLVDSYLVSTSMGPVSTMDAMTMQHPVMGDLSQLVGGNWQSNLMQDMNSPFSTIPTNSPDSNYLISRSYSNHSENSWTWIDNNSNRQSLDIESSESNVVSPLHLHNHHRTGSDDSSHHSDQSPSATHHSDHEIFPISPEPEQQFTDPNAIHDYQMQQEASQPLPPPAPVPTIASTSKAIASRSRASSSSVSSSPKSKRRTSPTGKALAGKKKGSASSAKEKSEKRVGRRKGPLKPEQRQSAHEIRKLRACMRCKFLKKVCDKGDPCTGCQPSHARLWQVPCTRIDIKDLAYFLKDWNADYERHVTLGFSVANIKGFDSKEDTLYITHGYGFMMPIRARKVYVRDEKVFDVDWIETMHDMALKGFEVTTAHLSTGSEGISKKFLSEYVDLHLDSGFDYFIDEYFEGTPFVSEALKSIYQFYLLTKQDNIRKGLKLVIAYALTQHITLLTGLPEEEAAIGRIDDPSSKYYGSTCAPVMINFEVKKAMADLWRDMMREVLEDLSALYSSVYNGDKLKNWPTIFMLAVMILCVWEMMQFDCHYRVPDEGAVTKFCGDMEHVPVGVIVGLFGAISTKLPTFLEWDTEKHGSVWNADPAICGTMSDFRGHVEKHEEYLKTRPDAKFDREDFDCLSNKFLTKLVIRG